MQGRNVIFSGATDNWATPQWLFDDLNEEFHFDLDVCASAENAKCKAFYTKEQDGLAMPWHGTVWCNPPYGREIGNWVRKAHEYSKNGGTAVMLIPSRTDTAWFHDYVYGQMEIRFLRGRVKFGGSKHGAPFPSMVIVFRETRNEQRRMT